MTFRNNNSVLFKYSAFFSFFILMMILLFFYIKKYHEHDPRISYWLWAGITAEDAPENSEFYIYQGLINKRDGQSVYKRYGLYPYPIKSQRVYLSYRIEGSLPEPKFVVNVFEKALKGWGRHNIVISGVQLDFDSPTSKLKSYSDFLEEIRKTLPEQYELSITGLGDWVVYGNKQVMQSIADHTSEVVFQLYQGRKEINDMDVHVRELLNYPFPYRVGLLFNGDNKKYIKLFSKNKNFKGVIYFIQRKK